MVTVTDIRSILEAYIDELNSHVDVHKLEDLLKGEGHITSHDVGSKPEDWTRNHLIRKLLTVVNLEIEPEIYGRGEGYPDFGITNLSIPVIGEDKAINNFEEAVEDIKKYLDSRAASRDAEYGIATDGIQWAIVRIELGSDYRNYTRFAEVDFRIVLLQIAKNKNYISQSGIVEPDIDKIIQSFIDSYYRDNLNILLTSEFPRKIFEEKKRNIKQFYDLYIDLLFGEGRREHGYDTTLINSIIGPKETEEFEKKKFAIKLVNRLLFIKFLEDKGVIREIVRQGSFLHNRVEDYFKIKEDFVAHNQIEDIASSLYKTQLEPLFFNLLNTPVRNRLSKYRGGWFDSVPYLNGSLFTPDAKDREFDVDDRILKLVVNDLVEGHRLQRESGPEPLDPSVLGHVFEMTINHMSSAGEDGQRKEGAYYTPSDVIYNILKNTVEPKVYEILVDVYARRLISEDVNEKNSRSIIMKYDLNDILDKIENKSGYFGDPNAIKEAYERIGDLKIIDPACGSGHFLTAVLGEIHNIRMSLLRGLKTQITPEEVYKSKKELVLKSIYGVDINPIAVEIAKLRVWLKMVEDGWSNDFGELPNIDINIVTGNSLIGLPAKSEGPSIIGSFNVNFDAIKDAREQYKRGQITRRELAGKIKELTPELNSVFLHTLHHFFENTIEDRGKFDEIFRDKINIGAIVKKIKVKKSDNTSFSDHDRNLLEEIGFRVSDKTASLDDSKISRNIDNLRGLLAHNLIIELERRPLLIDIIELENVPDLAHKPFHWVIEFPEAVSIEDDRPRVKFDIIVGNPPYGAIYKEPEKRFIKGYSSSKVDDISIQFIERQIQMLAIGGYYGNVTSLRFMYDKDASTIRDLIKEKLEGTKIACFATRPAKIFDSSDPRVAIITGKKVNGQPIENDILTSCFIRFTSENRVEKLNNIRYQSIRGLTLGDKIGKDGDFSLPKIGYPSIRSILETLKSHSDIVFRDVMLNSRDHSEFIVWRSRHPQYWINPFLEDLYPPDKKPQDFRPMYFNSQLEKEIAFLILQSSLFYMYWMTYGNQRDLNFGPIEAFPFPCNKVIQENSERIHELATSLWGGMRDRFDQTSGSLGEIRRMSELKPIVDNVDNLIGPLLGLTPEQIEFVKQYDVVTRSIRAVEEE
jgi:hypothetical protein